MKGKVCLVTGANNGIGFEVAKGLARQGAQVALLCRNPERAQVARDKILADVPGAQVELQIIDLSSMKSVRDASAEILSNYPRIHVLVNNAAVVNLERQESVDGYELVFATNHLGPFLLTNLLLDRIKESAPARIIFVGSDGHKLARIDFDDLHSLKSYGVMKTYGKAKSGNNLMMLELVDRLEGSGVTVNCLHPGAVDTKLGDNHGFIARVFGRLVKSFLMSSAKGAKTPLYLATSPKVEGVTGKYFYRCKEHPQAPYVLDKGEAKRLWEISEKLTGLSSRD